MAEDLELQFNYDGLEELPLPLELSIVNGDEVSTVKFVKEDVWETCVFYHLGDNKILAHYNSEEDARAGHRKCVDELLAELLLNTESKQ